MEWREQEELLSPEEAAIHEIPEGYDILDEERDELDELLEDDTDEFVANIVISEEDKLDAERFFAEPVERMPGRADGLRTDAGVADRNRAFYRSRAGRVCLAEGCDTKVRYTKEEQYCSVHNGGN